jgi:hypothetical protein
MDTLKEISGEEYPLAPLILNENGEESGHVTVGVPSSAHDPAVPVRVRGCLSATFLCLNGHRSISESVWVYAFSIRAHPTHR